MTIRVADLDASRAFYATTLGATGKAPSTGGDDLPEWDDFSIGAARSDRPVTSGLHIGFFVPSREAVHDFWNAGVEAGYLNDGEPGPRPQYTADYYGGFLLDPDGNSAEAVHREDVRRSGNVDHVWLRVADATESKRFYETVAPHAGFRLDREVDGRAAWVGERPDGGDFSIVAGPPSQNVHLAFPADTREDVDSFHAQAIEAGYRDNGAPGERPEYHPGYYGAFVLDPDGNNVEVVHHGR